MYRQMSSNGREWGGGGGGRGAGAGVEKKSSNDSLEFQIKSR